MTAWLVIGIVFALLALLLCLSVTLYVKWDEKLSIQVGAAGLKFWLVNPNEDKAESPRAEKKQENKKTHQKSPAKKSKKSPQKQKAKDKLGDLTKTQSFPELMELVLGLVAAFFPPTMNLFKHLRITSLTLRMSIGAEDASETATTYAGISAGIYCALAVLKANLVVKVKKIELRANFISGEVEQDVFFKVKIRLAILAWTALRMIKRYLGTLLKKEKPINTSTSIQTKMEE